MMLHHAPCLRLTIRSINGQTPAQGNIQEPANICDDSCDAPGARPSAKICCIAAIRVALPSLLMPFAANHVDPSLSRRKVDARPGRTSSLHNRNNTGEDNESQSPDKCHDLDSGN